MFLEHQISLLEWILKDDVTLETEIMDSWIFCFTIKLIACILKYIKIEIVILNCNIILQHSYMQFYCIFFIK